MVCGRANSSHFSEGECHVCGGAALKTDAMVQEAARLLAAEKAGSFSISTMMSRDWLAREERAWDERLAGAESVKSFLNKSISAALEKASGARYVPDGECRLVFDYSKGAVSLERNELFVFGRYMKLSAGLSQSRWRCPKCEGKGCPACHGKGMLYESVEERVGGPLKKAASADDYVMHASGREDVDATNSAGRPFVMELKGPKERKLELDSIAREIGEKGDVAVSGLRIVQRGFCELVTESHFDKTYEADVEFGADVDDDALARIRTLEGKTILQKTPTRVAHRRANLVRHRKVKHIEVVRRETENPKLATLIIKAEAGTYIKELISSDGGRTEPSVSGLLGMSAVCRRLEVVGIDDGFLDFCLAAIKR
ncbi:MAG: tRNA pseudouridine(54/55) synthase Pus10 [Candidatus Micrarchaeota archaeon]